MSKNFKIIRKKHSYRSGRSSLLRAVVIIVIAAALFAAGWFLYQPAYNWVMGLAQPEEEQSSQAEPVVEQQPQEEPRQPEPVPENRTEELCAVWIPAEAAANAAALEKALGDLPGDPVNAVVLELKDAKGRIVVAVANVKWSDYDEKNVLQINKNSFLRIV